MAINETGNQLKQVRIAVCHPDLGIGGAERLIVDVAAELRLKGHLVHVFTAHHDRKRCFVETIDGTFPVSVYGDFLPRHIFGRFHAVFAYLRCVYVAIAICLFWPKFDLVIVDQVSAVIPVLKLLSGAKVLFYCHFPDMLLAKRNSRLRKIYRAPIDWIEETTTGMADELVVNSKFTSSVFSSTFTRLSKQGIEPSVLYPAVSTRLLSSSDLEHITVPGIHEGIPFFLSINRFERKKNIELGIHAFSLLQKEHFAHKSVNLVIAGGYDPRVAENREYFEELRSLVSAEGMSGSVVFVPSFSDQEKAKLLSGCLCVIYTPQNEHFGIVPLEAMAAKKPVIACNSGGPRETILSGSTGFLCDPIPSSFASAMAKVLRDGTEAERMGECARSHVDRLFSRRALGDRLQDMVEQMMAGK